MPGSKNRTRHAWKSLAVRRALRMSGTTQTGPTRKWGYSIRKWEGPSGLLAAVQRCKRGAGTCSRVKLRKFDGHSLAHSLGTKQLSQSEGGERSSCPPERDCGVRPWPLQTRGPLLLAVRRDPDRLRASAGLVVPVLSVRTQPDSFVGTGKTPWTDGNSHEVTIVSDLAPTAYVRLRLR